MNVTSDGHIKRMMRYEVPGNRTCSLDVLAVASRTWTSLVTRLVDVSLTGVGVESDQPVHPGIAWFRHRMCGYKCGVVVWCIRQGARYRAGIQFVGLNHRDKECLKREREQQASGVSCDDRAGINHLIERIMKNQA